ncbi:hypothetical protein F4810DRAFT_267835 [Camillea tinctor]|nr:hypothetical protein F4810DRAFT_267835 [Camillea tinctor]
MNEQLVSTPPNSQDIHKECRSSLASSTGVDILPLAQSRVDEAPFQPNTAASWPRTDNSQSLFTGQPYQQLKLIDLCTQHEGLYLDCDDSLEFWDTIASKLPWDNTTPQVRCWVEFVCRDRKQCLLTGQIPPHREGSEKLDIAIDAWLQITGRKLLQTALESMRTASVLVFGPEESEEEHLFTKHCRDRLRSNMEYVRMQTTRKGKSNRVSGVRLVQAIESIESRVPGQRQLAVTRALTPEQFYDPSKSHAYENTSPVQQPTSGTAAAQTSSPISSSSFCKTSSDARMQAAYESNTQGCHTATKTESDKSLSQAVSTLKSLMADEGNLQREQGRERSLDLSLLQDLGHIASQEQSSRQQQQQQIGQPSIEAFSTFLPTGRDTMTTRSRSKSQSQSRPTHLIIPPSSPSTTPRDKSRADEIRDQLNDDNENDDVPMIDLTQSPIESSPSSYTGDSPSARAAVNEITTTITQAQLSNLIAAEIGAAMDAFEERAGTRIDHLEYHFRKLYGIMREIRAITAATTGGGNSRSVRIGNRERGGV